MDFLADLNEPQRRAVLHVDGPLLVLAGAGSGKTRVITRRLANLVQHGINPRNILAITFTNKAAGEMQQRAQTLGAASGATLCTFHALCARLLREFSARVRIGDNYTIYDRKDQIALTKLALDRLNLSAERFTPAAIHSSISKTKNDLKLPQSMPDNVGDYYMSIVAKAYAEYEKLLAENNALDFDDLLMRTAFLLRDHDDVRRQLADRYNYILIDEYQDTNRAQYIIAHAIAADHENICVTGDPDQSIYAWRGADIKNILEFERDYPRAMVVRLEENYRSSRAILAGASKLISCNSQRKEKDLWTRREGGNDVAVLHCDDGKSEATEVVSRIKRLRNSGVNYSDIAVFYRVNSLSRVLEEALLKAAVPYRVARGVEFYNRKEIKDVLAYLRLTVNPADNLSCKRIINTPARGIGQVTVKRIEAFANAGGMSFLDACHVADRAGLPAAACKKARAFAKMIDEISDQSHGPVKDAAEAVIRLSGMEQMLSDGGQDFESESANVNELINAAAEFDAQNEEATTFDYLQQVSLVSDTDRLKDDGGAVTLMTIHAAKGLEFPAVFIVGCEEGLLPLLRDDANERDSDRAKANDAMEEERRLAFVAMTRAKDHLTLTCVTSRMVRGRYVSQAPSRFLRQIGIEGITTEDLTSKPIYTPQPGRPGGGGFYAPRAGRPQAAIDDDFADVAIDPFDDSQGSSDYPSHYQYLKKGCTVRHLKFGIGKLVQLNQPWPETRAIIDFHQFGRKTIVLRCTELELV